ncbi:hypothetical protein [Streptomyces qaidamensis]|uniref:hypothetical protein n=1 Tax=Streptomyces qaidamensis TaxID=1783515 RepID=UPI00131ECB91|nr:hypothetical protein [Streptomyces qaidamensis]
MTMEAQQEHGPVVAWRACGVPYQVLPQGFEGAQAGGCGKPTVLSWRTTMG